MKHDLPGVGQNLQDHLDVVCGWNEIGKKSYGLSFGAIPSAISAINQYRKTSTGHLASNAAEAGAFIRSPGASRPDIQFHFCPGISSFPLPSSLLSLSREASPSFSSPYPPLGISLPLLQLPSPSYPDTLSPLFSFPLLPFCCSLSTFIA